MKKKQKEKLKKENVNTNGNCDLFSYVDIMFASYILALVKSKTTNSTSMSHWEPFLASKTKKISFFGLALGLNLFRPKSISSITKTNNTYTLAANELIYLFMLSDEVIYIWTSSEGYSSIVDPNRESFFFIACFKI